MNFILLLLFAMGNKLVSDYIKKKSHGKNKLLALSFLGHALISGITIVLAILLVPEASMSNLGDSPYINLIIGISLFSIVIAGMDVAIKHFDK